MAFTNSFRMERVYFERLKSMIDILKPYLNTETDEKLKSILENSIDDNGAILLLYRNLGECWAELSDLIKKANERIDSLDDKSEKYHDEINERIDEVNNYIMGILREIEARLETVEQDLATLSRNIILDLERVNDEYTLSYKGDPVDFAQLAEWVSFPDNVIIRGVVNGEETVFHLREFDTDETSGVFEFFATGLIDNVVHEITVTVLPDDSVNVATDIQTMKEYSAGNGIIIDSNDEISVDTDVIQEKLTAGSGISINPDTKEITNTAQGKIYTAGSGIAIDPDTNEISNTSQGKTYNSGFGINIDSNNNIVNKGGFPRIYNNQITNFISGTKLTDLVPYYEFNIPSNKYIPFVLYQDILNVNVKHDIIKANIEFLYDITTNVVDNDVLVLLNTKITTSIGGISFGEVNDIIYMDTTGLKVGGQGSSFNRSFILDTMGISRGYSSSFTANFEVIFSGIIINNSSETNLAIRSKIYNYLKKLFIRIYYGDYAD